MPPKGWRKDSQGNYPARSYAKEQEALTIDDLLFPKSSILNLAKEVQQENDPQRKLVISKDASTALQRSATVFVNHLLLFAREIARDQERKSCNVEDILLALDHIGHPGLKAIVRTRVDDYQRMVNERKQQKLLQQSTSTKEEEKEQQEEEEEQQEDTNLNKKQKIDTPGDTPTTTTTTTM